MLLGNKGMATGENGERINTRWLFDSLQHRYGMFIWTGVINLIFQTLFLSFGVKVLASGAFVMSSEYNVILTSSSFSLATAYTICVQVQAVQLINLSTVNVNCCTRRSSYRDFHFPRRYCFLLHRQYQ